MRQPGGYPEELKDQRVVKLLLPLALIRQMDRLLVDGIGGFATRTEFVREAIESYMLELTHEPAPAEPTPISARKRQLRPVGSMPTEATVTLRPASSGADRGGEPVTLFSSRRLLRRGLEVEMFKRRKQTSGAGRPAKIGSLIAAVGGLLSGLLFWRKRKAG